MTTITKEEVKAFIEQIESDLSNGWEAQIFELKLARIALASLEAEKGADPVVFTDERNLHHIARGRETSLIWGKQNQEVGDIPLYRHAQPVPVVPEDISGIIERFQYQADHLSEWHHIDEHSCKVNRRDLVTALEFMNSCRAAMLQGAEPVSNHDELQVIGWLRSDYNSDDKRDPDAPLFMLGSNNPSETWGVKYMPLTGNSPVTPDGWISCSERMPNDKDYVWCWGKSYGWTECDTFEGYYDWSRNKWWAVTDDVEEPASKVTHWMLLPEPPQQEVK
ncbi:DUF551 domain-containing protein [Salmonella enterica]|nr:DUF551 domain-containing protein [Salmonella enterica subsp. enterica serovar Livingstone]EEU6371731.1 DUF551 domain-containing protein [Salmonella enterica]EHF2805515.1 DUF551 domain-containing protein [Salmonella enterica]EKE2191950.1 DUF551 domain-containing protein [Salmonella enterica subsp. enterica serovar Livingstone]MDY56698.1 DUF551 domain-containing protein [Salmonella enterica subsp. enterica serovar Thompson]